MLNLRKNSKIFDRSKLPHWLSVIPNWPQLIMKNPLITKSVKKYRESILNFLTTSRMIYAALSVEDFCEEGNSQSILFHDLIGRDSKVLTSNYSICMFYKKKCLSVMQNEQLIEILKCTKCYIWGLRCTSTIIRLPSLHLIT